MINDSTWQDIAFTVHSSCSHRPLQTTAIDTVIDITTSHSDIGVAEHITSTTTTIDATFTNSDTLETRNASIIGCTDIYSSITIYIGLTTTAKYITCDSCSCDRNDIKSICFW